MTGGTAEQVWSNADTKRRKRSLYRGAGDCPKRTKTFANPRVCYQGGQHGKEGVDGSSPSEGFVFLPA
jgi:hypothetical protein